MTLHQKRLAAFYAAEKREASWQGRLKRALMNGAIACAFVFFFFLLEGLPNYFPRDLEALQYVLIASIVVTVVFAAAGITEKWIDEQQKWGGLWRALARTVFLVACIGLVIGAYQTADVWVPHFR